MNEYLLGSAIGCKRDTELLKEKKSRFWDYNKSTDLTANEEDGIELLCWRCMQEVRKEVSRKESE